jgi:hypothetical protein
MGQSTNAEISFGILFEEEYKFPWNEEHGGDIEEWWKDVAGYEPLFRVYDEQGEYLPGFSPEDPRVGEYFKHRLEWENNNPLPVELVNACSDSCPVHILAVPDSVFTVRRGYPAVISATETLDTIKFANELDKFMGFIKKYFPDELDVLKNMRWYLSSYWEV